MDIEYRGYKFRGHISIKIPESMIEEWKVFIDQVIEEDRTISSLGRNKLFNK